MNTKAIVLSFLLFSTEYALSAPEIVVNLAKQSYTVIDNNKLIKTGKVSTGKSGHRTPSGHFTIHTKYANVMSKKYKAPMNYAMFFIGSLYAIHQGVVPGYPASHGCIRVPAKDASYLFGVLPIGTHLTIK